jgi:hypothetical protein
VLCRTHPSHLQQLQHQLLLLQLLLLSLPLAHLGMHVLAAAAAVASGAAAAGQQPAAAGQYFCLPTVSGVQDCRCLLEPQQPLLLLLLGVVAPLHQVLAALCDRLRC